jgi:hypothetical protein
MQIKTQWGAHTCNLSYWGGRDQKNHGSRPAWANSPQDTSQPILSMVVCLSSQLCGEAQIEDQGPGIKWDPISKITKAKRAGGVAQVVECLEELRPRVQTPVPQKKKKDRKHNETWAEVSNLQSSHFRSRGRRIVSLWPVLHTETDSKQKTKIKNTIKTEHN